MQVRYLYADWPVATVYNGEGYPAIPFWFNVTAAEHTEILSL